MNWADLIVIAIVLISVIIGAKRGFTKSVLGIFSIVISILIASYTYPIVANYINGSQISITIEESIEKSFSKEEVKEQEEPTEDSKISFLPKSMQQTIEEGTKATVDAAKKTAAQTASTLVINLISIVLVFLIVRILMFLLTHLLNFLTKIPILKGINKLLGAGLGFLSGLFIVYLILAIITFSATLGEKDELIKEVKKSTIASYMYDNNFIVNIISEK